MSLILTSALIFTFFAVSSAEETTYGTIVKYDFESDESAWQYSAGNHAGVTLEKAQEDGNSYMRLTVPQGEYSVGNYMLYENPHAYLKLDGGFKLKPNSETVISARVRTNNLSLGDNKQFLMNVPVNDEADKTFCVGVEIKKVWDFNQNSLKGGYTDNTGAQYPIWHFDGDTAAYGNNKKPGTPTISQDNLSENTWYTVKSIITTNAGGNPQKIRYDIKDDNGNQYITSERDGLSWSLYENTSIDRLDFAWFLKDTTFSADATFDFDDITIYNVQSVTATLVKSQIYPNEAIELNFPAEPDNINEIKLLDSNCLEIASSLSYDSQTGIVTVTPSKFLEAGEYEINTSSVTIKGHGLYENRYSITVISYSYEPLHYTFDEGADGWTNSMGWFGDKVSYSYEKENENGFLRLNVPKNDTAFTNQHWFLYKHPRFTLKLSDKYGFKPLSEVVISAKIRSNDVTSAQNVQFLMNVPDDSIFCTGVGLNRLWSKEKNAFAYYVQDNTSWNPTHIEDGKQSYGYGRPAGMGGTLMSDLSADKWYNIKTILITDSMGYPKEMKYEVYDDSGLILATDPSFTNLGWSLKQKPYLDRLDFTLFVNGLTPLTDMTIDLDEVSVDTYEDYEASVTFKDETGGTLLSAQNGKKVYSSLNFKNNAGITDFTLITALYENKDGGEVLRDVMTENVSLENYSGTSYETAGFLTIPETGSYTVKAYLWDKNGMTPFMDKNNALE